MNKKTITVSILVLVFIGGFLVLYNPKPVPLPAQENAPVSGMQQKLGSKVDDQASVTVTATPSDLGTESKEWKFDIVMSTHSVELDSLRSLPQVLVGKFENLGFQVILAELS